jgi:hypothetical protein
MKGLKMKWFGCLVLLFLAGQASAQSLEPRFYSNAPKGMNFLLGGYIYSYGGLAFDPALAVDDAKLHINTPVIAYARSLGFFGKSAKFDIAVPYSYLSGTATQNGNPIERDVDGFNDPQFRASVNFIGAPALSLKEFMAYQQDFVMGASLKMTAPLGQYDNTKLVNIGQNRWSFTPELGMSKTFGPLILEVAGAVTLYTENDDVKGVTLDQDAIYSMQAHLVYTFPKQIWIALDGTYYAGGETTVGGVEKDNPLSNTRLGATLAFPVNKKSSIKLYGSEGISKRTGSDFTVVGAAWQYRWGGGL